MKKLKSKNLKIILAAFGTTLLMTPIVAVTTVACSAQSLSQEKTIEIKTQPVNQSAIIGQNENLPTFSVQAQTKDFSKNLNYQWYSNMIESNENGTKIDGANSSTYVVPKNKLLKVQKIYFYVEISGNHWTNELLPIKSNVAVLDVDFLPKLNITAQPVDDSVIIGQTENLPVFSLNATSGHNVEKLNYQWYSSPDGINEGSIIPGETNSSYVVKQDDIGNIGDKKYFYAKVNGSVDGNPLIPKNTRIITLNTINIPLIKIISQSENKTGIWGQTEDLPAFFTNASSSNSNEVLQYQWYLSNDGTVNNATLIPGATSASYTIDKSYFTELGDKNFFVKISGLVNGVQLTSINSEIMTLTVSGAPVIKISTQPKEENVSVGQTTNFPTFRVQASTGLNGESLTYQWYSNTENSFDGAQTISSANQNSYTITKDDVGTSGITKKYFFVKIGGSISGINLEEVVSNIVTLTTLPSIKIDTQLKDLAVLIGQINLPTLSIFASNENPNVILKYQWYSNDKNSIDGAIELSGEESTSYKIKSGDVQEPGIKYFFVKISGTIDGFDLVPVYSNISALNVKSLDSAIQITIQPENQEGILSQTENLPTFTVQATTGFENENLTYQWYQNAVVSTQNGFPISGEINPSFTPSKKYFSETGQKIFYVKISGNANGIELTPIYSNIVFLTVRSIPPIKIIQQPSIKETVLHGQTENLPTLSVKVDAPVGTNLTYQWKIANNLSVENPYTDIIGATNSTYQIKSDDLGIDYPIGKKYFVVIIKGNLNGTQLFPVTSNQTTLITVPPIIINVLETNKTAILNQTENLPTFSVDATTNNSNENLVYQWYMTETGSVNDGILIEGATSSLYNIPASDLSKIGTKYYYVKVSGAVNSVAILPKNSAIMTLNIINP